MHTYQQAHGSITLLPWLHFISHTTWLVPHYLVHTHTSTHTHTHTHTPTNRHMDALHYGVATTSRLLKMIGLFCKRALEKRWYSAKEKPNFKEPINRNHPIAGTISGQKVEWYSRDLFFLFCSLGGIENTIAITKDKWCSVIWGGYD